MKFNIGEKYAPYIPLGMQKIGVETYTQEMKDGRCIVEADISNRAYKALIRAAYAAMMTDQTGVRHLTREDVGKNVSGAIPESEQRFFEAAWL